MSPSETVGYGDFRFRPVLDWPVLPNDVELAEAIGVTVDAQNRLIVFNRGEPAVFIFDASGEFVETWGDNEFTRPHGITATPAGRLLLVDDLGHRVAEYSVRGERLRDIGPANNPVKTGVERFDYRQITPGHGPFNLPTNAAIARDGHIFVADGYGNARVHHFLPDGTLQKSWGRPGDGPGEFNVPHGICLDSSGRILVADRENSRIQIFDREGGLIDIWQNVVRPCQVLAGAEDVVYVAELGNQNGRFPWQPAPSEPIGGRVSVFDADGHLLSRWGGGLDARKADAFYACHDIATDALGNLYIGEVAVTAAAAVGDDATDLPKLRKFERL